MKITMLGCGSSAGVPIIGCDCAVCASHNPKNKRSRVSVFIENNGQNLLIDSSPDLRAQALANHITRVDAVLYTHDHADHTHGIDELRSFNYLSKEVIDIYGDNQTISLLKQRFAYAFLPKPENIWFRPCLVAHTFPDQPVYQFTLGNTDITAFHQRHGKSNTLGYRIGNFAYSTDTDSIPEAAYEALAGVEVWIVDCLRYSESYSHSHLDMTLEWISRLKPKLAILTHMAHDFDYDTLKAQLPEGVVPGYDGLQLEIA